MEFFVIRAFFNIWLCLVSFPWKTIVRRNKSFESIWLIRIVLNVYILKKVAKMLATFFHIYFVFRTSFFVFIFSPATESPTFPGLSPAHNITRAEPWKRWRWMVFSNWIFPIWSSSDAMFPLSTATIFASPFTVKVNLSNALVFLSKNI